MTQYPLKLTLTLTLALSLVACQAADTPRATQTSVALPPSPGPDAAQTTASLAEDDPQDQAPPNAAAKDEAAPAADEGAGRVAEAACTPWPARRLEPPTPTDALLPNGLASAGVRADTAILWARTSRQGRLRAIVSAGPDCPEIKTPFVATERAQDRIVHIPVSALTPGTLHRFLVEIEGHGLSSPAWFSTAPIGDKAALLAFSADVSGFASEVPLLDDLVAAKPEIYLSLGDWPYADLFKDPTQEADFLQHYNASRQGDRVTRMTRSMPIHAVWDDHEIINDWDARYNKWNPDSLKVGTDIWRRWWPVAGAPPGEIYRKYKWGDGLEVFHLDTRLHRDSNAAPFEGKSMLGRPQRDWLLDGLAASTARFKLVITSVPLDYGKTFKDSWVGFVQERAMLLDHLRDKRITGVVFLTADQHWYASHHLHGGARQWQVGPLAYKTFKPIPHPKPEVIVQGVGHNFGLLRYTPGPSATLTFEVHLTGKGAVYTETLREGAGLIRVKASSPAQRWRIEGAHRFVGQGPAELPMAPPGAYTITWSAPAGASTSAELVAGGEVEFAP